MDIKKCVVQLKSKAPFQFGKAIVSPKERNEKPDAYEERTWRERMHVDNEGIIFIPAMALKLCMEESARFLGETIPGKGKATYTKHFEAGTMVVHNLSLGIKAKDVEPNRLFVPSDGKKGGGKRVWKQFPTVPEWQTTAEILVLDRILQDQPVKVREYLEHGGNFIGMGGFRPRRGGYFGRFDVVKWSVSDAST